MGGSVVLCAVAAIGGCAVLASQGTDPAAHAAPRSPGGVALAPAGTIVDLGTLGGATSIASGVNARGQVTGASLAGGQEFHAFRWTPAGSGKPAVMTDLGSLGGGSGEGVGTAINPRGRVAGRSESAKGILDAFLWTPGGKNGVSGNPQMRDLGTLGGNGQTEGWALNRRNQVAGDSTTVGGDIHAFLWSPRGKGGVPGNPRMLDLGTLGGTFSIALGVNASGQVTGTSGPATGENRAYLWQRGKPMRDLGTLGGGHSFGRAINVHGQVAGYSSAPAGNFHPFLWTPNGTAGVPGNPQMQDLFGTSPGSEAYALNDLGEVAGRAQLSGGALHAFLWRQGQSIDLNTLLPAGSGWSLEEAVGINNKGQVVGTGTNSTGATHAYLLQFR